MSDCARQTGLHSEAAKHNVFMTIPSKPLRLELALLAAPLLAICVLLTLLPHGAQPDNHGKVTLRVTSVTAPYDAELAREAVMRREQIQFALSKVAKGPEYSEPADDKAPAPVAGPKQFLALAQFEKSQPAHEDATLPAPKADVKRVATKRRLAGNSPRDIRPVKLRRTAGKVARKSAVAKKTNWLTASLRWPVEAASATIKPVTQTLTLSVSRAGDALQSLKQKIL